MSGFGDAAAGYAARGWAVLPLVTRDKVPAIKGGCKSATTDDAQIRAWWGANPTHNVAVATGSPSLGLVVIDLDVDDDKGVDGCATLRAWELEHGELPETVTAVTGRGGLHMFYRCNTPIGCSINDELGVDIRGEGGYVVVPPSVHPNGRAYCWENDPGEYRVAAADDNVYAFIRHVQGDRKTRERFSLPKTIGSGARNDTLFRYASSLQAQGYDDVYISVALSKVNEDRCKPPLSAADVEKIVESVTGRYEKGDAPKAGEADGKARPERRCFRKLDRNGNPTGAVLHNVVARELIENHRACFVDGAPAIWDGSRYAAGWDEVNRAIVGLIDDCKMADQKEIRHYVHLMAPKVEASPPTLIAFRNGVYDLDAGFGRYEPGMVITNVIPHDYNVNAECALVDSFLDAVSCGDATVRSNLEEVIGACMYRGNDFGQCPVLIGSGSNGKSTFILAVRGVLGDDNVSSLDINVVGKPFQAGRLLGRLANLGDDISNERLNGDVLSVFKKIVTGEWIYTDVKNGDGFEFKPYCTLVFSCNEFPSLGDSSEGMLRRLFPIPFDAHFSKADAGYDPRLWDKLRTEDAAGRLIVLGLQGLRRLREQNGFTPNARSSEVVDEVRADNDSVLQWVSDCELADDYFDGRVIALEYDDYCEWCRKCNLRPYGRTKYTRKVCAALGYMSKVERREMRGVNRSVRVFRRDG